MAVKLLARAMQVFTRTGTDEFTPGATFDDFQSIEEALIDITGSTAEGEEFEAIVQYRDEGYSTTWSRCRFNFDSGVVNRLETYRSKEQGQAATNDAIAFNSAKELLIYGVLSEDQLNSKIADASPTIVGEIKALSYKPTTLSGYLNCDGAAVSRTTYADLFAAIGTTYGVGDGSTTFNLPDLRGEFLRGFDDGRGIDTGRAIGTAQTDQMESHSHTASTGNDTHNHTGSIAINNDTHNHTGSSGNDAHDHGGLRAGATNLGSANGPYLGNTRYDNSWNRTYSSSIGSDTHNHSITVNNDTHNHTGSTSINNDTHNHTVTVNSTGGTGNSAENRPRNVAVHYVIKT